MKKMRQMATRIFSLFLALVMLCTVSDMTAFAQEADTTISEEETGQGKMQGTVIRDTAETEESEAELEQAKKDAKAELAAYAEELQGKTQYSPQAVKEMAKRVKDMNENFDVSANINTVQGFLIDAKRYLDDVDPNMPDKTLEEIKEDAKEELKWYQSAEKYELGSESLSQWEQIVTNGNAAIDNAEDEEAVNSALDEAKAEIDKLISGGTAAGDELDAAKKNAAIEELDTEYNKIKLSDYSSANQTKLKDILEKAKQDINAAKTTQELENILEKAKKDLKSVPTSKDEQAAIRQKELQQAQEAAIRQLEQYLDKITDYTPGGQNEIETLVNNAIKAVKRAKYAIDVQKELQNGKNKIEYKMAQFDSMLPKLSTVKNKAIKELEMYKPVNYYRAAQKKELQNVIKEAIAAIEAATTRTYVAELLKNAKAKIDKIKTDTQLTEEEGGPAKTAISGKIKAQKKGFTVKWKKQTKNVDGYEVCYSTSKKFPKKGTVTKTISKNATTKLTVKNLKAKKKYYVKVRAYKKTAEKKFVSSWSPVKMVKTKK